MFVLPLFDHVMCGVLDVIVLWVRCYFVKPIPSGPFFRAAQFVLQSGSARAFLSGNVVGKFSVFRETV